MSSMLLSSAGVAIPRTGDEKRAEQGARANDHGCHASCSEQHESRQPRSWLILNVGRSTMKIMRCILVHLTFMLGAVVLCGLVSMIVGPIIWPQSPQSWIPHWYAFGAVGSILAAEC